MRLLKFATCIIATLSILILHSEKTPAAECRAGYFSPVGWSADSVYAAMAFTGASSTDGKVFARLYVINTTKNEQMMKYEISACDDNGKCIVSKDDFAPGAVAKLLEKLIAQSADTLEAYTISTQAVSFEPLECSGVKTMADQNGTRIISIKTAGRPDTKELFVSISSGSLNPVVFGEGGAIRLSSIGNATGANTAKTNIDTEFLETVPSQKIDPAPLPEKPATEPEKKPDAEKAEEEFETMFSTPANKKEPEKEPAVAPIGSGKCPVDMVFVPAGEFQMGCSRGDDECRSDEIPPAAIKITKGFCIDKYEVSQAAFQELMKSNPSVNTECGPYCPVESVSWQSAATFCKQAGKRLPTEAEWEYAARGSSEDRYYWGPLGTMGHLHAWFWEEGGVNGIHPSGEKEPNRFGLHDVTGNVWEWVQDCYSGVWYASIPAKDPVNEQAICEERVMRGGSWINGDPTNLRVSVRNHEKPDVKAKYIGFRCVAPPMD